MMGAIIKATVSKNCLHELFEAEVEVSSRLPVSQSVRLDS
jgi:hypothetical protein